MYCAECGKQIVTTAKHCVYCGTPVAPVAGDSGSEVSQAPPPAPAARVGTTPPPVPPPYAAPPPPVPPAPGYAYGAARPPAPFVPPPPGYAAPGYPAAQPAGRGALALRLAGAACFVIALVGSFLPFMTASSLGGDADDAGTWFMLWRDTGWGPAIGALIALALICSVVPKRATALIAALISLPAIVLIPIRGSVYHGLQALGINIGFGVGFFLLLVFTVAGCALCFAAFARMRRHAVPPGWGVR